MKPMRVTETAVQELGPHPKRVFEEPEDVSILCFWYSRANQPSSSSLRLGAGRGAPGPSCVGSLT